MIGAILGDIVGSIYEFDNIKTKEFELFDKECFFTDDSVMTIAIAEALMQYENIDEIKDVKNAIIKNFSEDKDVTGLFTCDEIVAVEDYIVRTTEDATFTDKVIVTIGSDKMISGSKEIALDAPAYISGGRTMLPVRAITEALSDNAVITWNDATKTVTILFGNRVISMTIGSNVMYINGVALAMTAAPEITNSRTFLPLRDLAYALGLNDSKIDWNDITKTVTLN